MVKVIEDPPACHGCDARLPDGPTRFAGRSPPARPADSRETTKPRAP